MSKFVEKLRLKERAEEDLYFAKRDAELIAALHREDRGGRPHGGNCGGEERADTTATNRQAVSDAKTKPARAHRAILDRIQSIWRRFR